MFSILWLNLKTTPFDKEPFSQRLTDVLGGIRTPDRSLRRRMLYPAELLEQ